MALGSNRGNLFFIVMPDLRHLRIFGSRWELMPDNVKFILQTSDTYGTNRYIDAKKFPASSRYPNKMDLMVPAEVLGMKKISGIFFLTLVYENQNKEFLVTSNFFKYHRCLLDRVLALGEFKNCKPVNSGCKDCTDNAVMIHTLLDSLYKALHQHMFTEAIFIMKNLDEMCEICHKCNDMDNVGVLPSIPGFSTNDFAHSGDYSNTYTVNNGGEAPIS